MTALATINATMLARGMQPITDTCPCCGHLTDRDDMMGDVFCTDTTDAILARYGGPICIACADNHHQCAECGDMLTPDCQHVTSNGDTVCAECLDEVEADYALSAAHERQERHGWEQV